MRPVELASLGQIIRGVTYSKADARDVPSPGLVPVLRAGNIQDAQISLTDLVYVPASCVRDEQVLREGDVLIAMSSGSADVVGKAAMVRKMPLRAGFGAFCSVFRPSATADKRWLRHYFASPIYKTLVREAAAGVNINNLKASHLLTARVPLPDEAERARAGSKLDALLAESRAARDQLAAVPDLVETYRQSVLAAAFRGDLTADWRKKNPDVEPASKLLERIRIERRKAWEAAELAKMIAKGKPPKDDRWKAKYTEPEPVDTTGLPELPATWCWANGSMLFTWGSGKFLPKDQYRSGSVPIFGGNGISGHHADALVDHRTLVVGRVGANCGNVYLSDGPAWITDNAIYATWMTALVSPEHLLWAFRFADLNSSSGGSGQPFVSQTTLDGVAIPLPPLDEQAVSGERLRAASAGGLVLASTVRAVADELAVLETAVLARSFGGELLG